MKWIGIDFGTTNSVAAILEVGKIQETLGGKSGQDPIPTLVSYFQEDYRFGFEAREDSIDIKSPRSIIGDLKPHLGRVDALRVDGVPHRMVEDLTGPYLQYLRRKLNL